VGYALLTVFTAAFPGVLVYFICALILPNKSAVDPM
jgi:phage shock protein PspC (stress-responsive transcriptional regulator)